MALYRCIFTAVVFTITLFAAMPAEACRVFQSPEQKLSGAYSKSIISAVVAVTVTDAKHTRPFAGDSHPWSATALVDTVLSGTYEPREVMFNRGGGSAACHTDIANGNALPKRGDRWIVYIWTSPNLGPSVWITYPFDVAATADPVLGPAMSLIHP